MKKGFTLVETLVVITILIIIGCMVVGGLNATKDGENFDYSYLDPEYESAKNSRIIAEQLKRQNDLMEQQMQQKNAEKE